MTISQEKLNSLPEPPGGGGLPLIGETIAFFTDPDFNQKRVAKYGRVYKTNLLGSSTAMMVGAEANTLVLP